MTTAASAISPDGVWCCPTNLPWAGASPWCSTTLTKGTFQSFIGCDLETEFSAIAFGPRATQSFSFAQGLEVVGPGGTLETHFSTVTANTIKVVVSAKGVFLMGQTMAKEIDEGRVTANSASVPLPATSITAPTASAVLPNTNQPISTTSGDDSPSSTPSKEVPIGAIVGGVIGGLILAGLLYFILSRRRKTQQNSQPTTTVVVHHEDNNNPYNDDYKKAELDASARDPRSELEGTRVSTYGAGIYNQKAELEGTRGMNDVSAYVKNKVELEARHIHVAELEAIPYSVPTKEETPQSPTVKHEWSPTHRLG
ncbi:hypothetical protein F4774DRAFT_374965 [Daldinia eschscholtzii]|nr:hypothetical protein F4774DRAFT_374965 [Daldinia eschscholtzii]